MVKLTDFSLGFWPYMYTCMVIEGYMRENYYWIEYWIELNWILLNWIDIEIIQNDNLLEYFVMWIMTHGASKQYCTTILAILLHSVETGYNNTFTLKFPQPKSRHIYRQVIYNRTLFDE